MALVPLLITILVLAVAFWLVARYVPDPFRMILLVVLGIIAVVWVVRYLGIR